MDNSMTGCAQRHGFGSPVCPWDDVVVVVRSCPTFKAGHLGSWCREGWTCRSRGRHGTVSGVVLTRREGF
jgi:hypothetical protein